MSKSVETANTVRIKAIVLAAGATEVSGTQIPVVMQSLDNRPIIEHVLENVRNFVGPTHTCVVVPENATALRKHAGADYIYAVQAQPLGTGNAVMQAASFIEEHDGDVLVVYGDLPLLRPNGLRGLLNRHRLKNADLTVLSAIVDEPLPYGRIIRDSSGSMTAIVEEDDADASQRTIRELNIGVYVVRAKVLLPALKALSPAAVDGNFRFTDCVIELTKNHLKVESFHVYAPDQVLGINSLADLAKAEKILEERSFHPVRSLAYEHIVFGTGGWRAIIGEGFSLANVRRLTQALANAIIRRGDEDCGALIGYDRRFLSDRAAEACAEVFAGNNIPVSLLPEPTPTPLVTFATAKQQAAYGLVFTASHNPPEYNGLKVFAKSGALLLAQETDDIESEANHLGAEDVVRIDLDVGLRSEIVARPTFANDYLDMVESKVDMAAIRAAGLATVIDPMFGVGKATLEVLLTEARCRVLTIHGRHDPLFGGRSPAPDLGALDSLRAAVRDGGFDVGMATDGDADRIAIIDERGEYVDINDLLLLLYFHLRQTRGMRGGVVRNLSTTQMLDRLAAHFGELCVETPVGFKHIVAGMQEHDALLGGESSGGLTIRGHILGKDGILGAALVVEMLAHSGKTVSALLDQVHNITGRLYIVEESIPATPQMRVIIPQRLRDGVTAQIGTHTVESVSNLDGTKVRLGQDHSVLIRFSGTEPVLRIQAEASSREECHELIGHIKAIAGIATA